MYWKRGWKRFLLGCMCMGWVVSDPGIAIAEDALYIPFAVNMAVPIGPMPNCNGQGVGIPDPWPAEPEVTLGKVAGCRRTESVDAQGNGRVDRTTVTVYDSYGRPIKAEYKNLATGIEQASWFKYSCTNGLVERVGDSDGDGEIDRRTVYWYDEERRLAGYESIDAELDVATFRQEYVYQSTDQQLPTTTATLVRHASGVVERSVDRWFYDASGQLIEHVWRVAPSGKGRSRSRMEWRGGRVVRMLVDHRDLGTLIDEHLYSYENDLLVEMSIRELTEDEPHWRWLWRYDDEGRLVEEEDWRGGHVHSVVTYGYDDRDRVINSSAAASNGRVIANTTVVYDGCL